MKLIDPSVELESKYGAMIKDWESTGEQLVPFVLRYDYSDFQAFITQMENETKGLFYQHEHVMVPHSTYWLMDEDQNIVGVSNLRHKLNEALRKVGGHIGYGIAPSHRRKGYATLILELSLLKAGDMGIGDVLVTCHKDNIGSAKSILKNGGILEQELELDGKAIENYWIRI